MSSESRLTKEYDQKIEQGSDTDDAQSQNQQTPETFAGTEEERQLVRKFDWRILPITCLLYLFACPSSFRFCPEIVRTDAMRRRGKYSTRQVKSRERTTARATGRYPGWRQKWDSV